jgi:hypothetical protein
MKKSMSRSMRVLGWLDHRYPAISTFTMNNDFIRLLLTELQQKSIFQENVLRNVSFYRSQLI